MNRFANRFEQTELDDALDAISVLDNRIRFYNAPALPLPRFAHATVHISIHQTGQPIQMLDLIACLLADEYYSPTADSIMIGVQHVLVGTELEGYNFRRAVATLNSRLASAA
jgi:hypothetical protein